MIFLASLPRSGSTLLTSLLNQRPDTYASPTSNLCDTMGAAVQSWEQNPTTQAQGGSKEDLYRILKGIADSRYDTDKTVFDKSRGWVAPQIMETMGKVQGDVKIIATVRPIADCLASSVKIAKPDNIKDFCKNGNLAQHLFTSYHHLKAGYAAYPDNFLLIEYDDLIKDPQAQLDRIAEFTGIKPFVHTFDNVTDSKEVDKAWGIKNLHKVRKKVSKRRYSAKKLLGNELYNFYQGGEFWNDKPEPVRGEDALDLQLEASLRGEFKKAGQITDKLLVERPNCNRVKFNAGWHELYKGNLLKGYKFLDYGRNEDVFGNKAIGSSKPIWNGERNVTVLMVLEGGLGDQLHGIRYAKNIAEYGNKVVVAGSQELSTILQDCEGVSAFVQNDIALGVYHDYWLPSMSAVVPLNLEFKDLSGTPYIKRTRASEGKVGVKWSGNPEFEHEQYRVFPKELMFDAVKDQDCISLQKEGDIPDWMGESFLESWEDTKDEISKCDLVISSCTSVAHLSAAMGIETWIVVPILPYYLWALPGDTTPYYECVTIFRQEQYNKWEEPFIRIKELIDLRDLEYEKKPMYKLSGTLADPVFM